jgi:hypothetical protein
MFEEVIRQNQDPPKPSVPNRKFLKIQKTAFKKYSIRDKILNSN